MMNEYNAKYLHLLLQNLQLGCDLNLDSLIDIKQMTKFGQQNFKTCSAEDV